MAWVPTLWLIVVIAVAALPEEDAVAAPADRIWRLRRKLLESRDSLAQFDSSRDWLVFVHVPKCGGSSLGEILLQEYGSGCGSNMNEWATACASVKVLNEDELERLESFVRKQEGRTLLASKTDHLSERVLSGVAWDICLLLMCTNCSRLVTIVRDPVSRLVSEYQYVLNEIHSHRRIQFLDPSHRKAILNSETQMSIVDYAMLEGTSFALGPPSNRATWQLQREKNSKLRSTDSESMQTALTSAMHSLGNDFVFVGILEAWELSLATLAMTLSGSLEKSLEFAAKASKVHRRLGNSHQSPLMLTDAQVSTLRELNWADIELYKFAAQILYVRAQAFGLPERLLATLPPS